MPKVCRPRILPSPASGHLSAAGRPANSSFSSAPPPLRPSPSCWTPCQLVLLLLRPSPSQAIPQLLDTLRQMIGRSSKLAVQLAVGGLVPWLLAMIEAAAPILRVKLLEIIR